jgi:hypothetical protein
MPYAVMLAMTLLGVERRGLLTKIDVAVDVAGHAEHRRVGDPARIRECPERRAEARLTDCLCQLACRFAPLAVDRCDVRPDLRVLGDVTVVTIADLDLEPSPQ